MHGESLREGTTGAKLLTLRRTSPPGAPDSSLGIASLSPRTRSGGVRGFVLKKFMVDDGEGGGRTEWTNYSGHV